MAPGIHLATDGAHLPCQDTGDGEIWLDLTRLLWSVNRTIGLTGIDRVELAYAEFLLEHVPHRLRFVTFDYRGSFRFVPHGLACSVVQAAAPAWRDGTLQSLASQAKAALGGGVFFGTKVHREARRQKTPVYLNVSSHPLHRERAIRNMMSATGAVFVPLLHDIIPIEHPEYVREPWVERTHVRLATVRNLASGVLTNSAATARAVKPFLPEGLPLLSLPLGVPIRSRLPAPQAPSEDRPYFVFLSTIEPRKNHITLLHLWRRFAATLGPSSPRLVLVGARGWETEHVADILDRCAAIQPHVEERGRLSDQEVSRLMAGARALLMPSFAEGYGLPVAEALAAGLPVICSDIAAHHEIGGPVPDYIDPIDALEWSRVILDYAAPRSPRRAAQLARLASWRCPTWDDHVSRALEFIDALAGPASPELQAGCSEMGLPIYA